MADLVRIVIQTVGRWPLTVLSVVVAFFASEAWAVPACPAPFEVEQSDGTRVTLRKRGDEFLRWHEDEEGFTVVRDAKTRDWFYAELSDDATTLVPSATRVGARAGARPSVRRLLPQKQLESARTAKARQSASAISSDRSLGTSGTVKQLVVLVAFSDLSFVHTKSDFDNLFNQVGYSADGNMGSVRDYYNEVSYGKLCVQSTVVGPLTMSKAYSYYGGNVNGNDARMREFAEDVLKALHDAGVNFSDYDSDGDGWMDELDIIHAGWGEEYGSNSDDNIWSARWSYSNGGYFAKYDGVKVGSFHTEPELRGSDSVAAASCKITQVGVVCHEFGHSLGLPDLYDTDYSSEGAGNFCLMAGGSWGYYGSGDSGTCPASMSAWCKKELGWIVPTEITAEGTYSLPCAETNQTVFMLKGNLPGEEYFLLENKTATGFGRGLPGTNKGMLIWHVDDDQSDNDDESHYMVDLEEASGTQHLEDNDNRGNDEDYFRSTTKANFTSATTPNNTSYSGTALGLEITSISAPGATMTFTVSSTAVAEPPDLSFATFSSWSQTKFSLFTSATSSSSGSLVRLFKKGAGFSIIYGFGNFGDGPTCNAFLNLIEIVDSSGEKKYSGTTSFAGPYAPKAGKTSVNTVTSWKNLPAGVYSVDVTLDYGDDLAESDETDNKKSFLFAIRDSVTLATALDNSGLSFTTSSTDCWYGTKGYGSDGTDCAATLHRGDSTTNDLMTTVTGPGTIAFNWKVSCEKGYDKLQFLVDGVVTQFISGTGTSWTHCSVNLSSGTHQLTWRYAKDKSVSAGMDCAWLDNVQWTPFVNDDFNDAMPISGVAGSLSASNVDATSESGEPLLKKCSSATTTVWWKWTAPSAGSAQIDTIGSSFDTVLGVYTGSSLASLALVAYNDDTDSTTRASKCTLTPTAGTTYYICVAGYAGKTGSIVLNWNLTVPDAFPKLSDDATSEDVATVLTGSKDDGLVENITTPEEYASFREWADKVKVAGGTTAAGQQAVWESSHAWLSYALGCESLIAEAPKDGELAVEQLEPSSDGTCSFTVGITGIDVGSEASAENLKKVFGIVGGSSPTEMSASEVSVIFAAPANGKATFTVGPKTATQKAFFLKVGL